MRISRIHTAARHDERERKWAVAERAEKVLVKVDLSLDTKRAACIHRLTKPMDSPADGQKVRRECGLSGCLSSLGGSRESNL